MYINCMIVDDDIISVEIIKSYIEVLQGLKIIGVCYDAISAYEIIQNNNVDIIFLDIEMPKLSGIDFIKTLNNKHNIKFVIVTGSKEYAVQSYELNVLDYIIKPLHFERFFKTLNKYHELTTPKTVIQNTVDNAKINSDAFVYIKENKKIIKIFLKDILFVESIKNYVRIVTVFKSVITKQAITYFEQILPSNDFIRIHRSYIVAVSKIEAFTAINIEIGNKEIPIGRSYKTNVLKNLNYYEPL